MTSHLQCLKKERERKSRFKENDSNILVMEGGEKGGGKQKLVIKCSFRDIKQLSGLVGR